MNFNGDGHTSGSADDGLSRAAHAPFLCFKATAYGILLYKLLGKISDFFFSELLLLDEFEEKNGYPVASL